MAARCQTRYRFARTLVAATVLATAAAAEEHETPGPAGCVTLSDGRVVCGTVPTSPRDPAPIILPSRPSVTGNAPPSRGGGDPLATRLFATSAGVPPADYRAYAVVATRRIPSAEKTRYIAICKGFANLLNTFSTTEPKDLQLVTVWPVRDASTADALNETQHLPDACDRAVDSYDAATGILAVRDAMAAVPGLRTRLGRGPFLFAWNPAASKGAADVPLFRMDLSRVETQAQAAEMFDLWSDTVVSHPELWMNDWQRPEIRTRIRVAIENEAGPALAALGRISSMVALLFPESN